MILVSCKRGTQQRSNVNISPLRSKCVRIKVSSVKKETLSHSLHKIRSVVVNGFVTRLWQKTRTTNLNGKWCYAKQQWYSYGDRHVGSSVYILCRRAHKVSPCRHALLWHLMNTITKVHVSTSQCAFKLMYYFFHLISESEKYPNLSNKCSWWNSATFAT